MIYIDKKISLAVGFFLLLSACGESVESEAGPEFGLSANFTETELIEHLTQEIIQPKHQAFSQLITAQTDSLNTYCQSLTDQGTIEKVEVQEAFKKTLAAWQMIEVMQLQILSADNNAIRNKIYSWPDSTTSCGVDQDVAFFASGSVNGQAYDITTRLNNRKGLDALEYLLFTNSTEHSCKVESGPLVGWNDLSEQDKELQRCQYATEVSQDIKNTFSAFMQTWYSSDAPYLDTLLQGDPKEAINTLGQALFYVDFLKDNKLGIPLGYFDNQCGNAPCPADVESFYSQLSLDNIKDNLTAFQALFSGSSETDSDADNADLRLGFDDYLIAVGDAETAQTILTSVSRAQTLIQSIEGDFATALVNQGDNFTQYQALHSEIKAITDQLKTHFITSLAVELPASSAGDND